MKLPSSPPKSVTERLTLRELRPGDAETIARLADDPSIRYATHFVPPESGESTAESWIAEVTRKHPGMARLTWVITETGRGTIYGLVTLRCDLLRDAAELDGWIGVPFRGQGFASEAWRHVIDTAFHSFSLHRLEARHLMRESAAARLAEKMQFLPEGVRRKAEKWNGKFEDIAYHGLLRNDLG